MSRATTAITVELFGLPRLLVGDRAVEVPGSTLAEVAAALIERAPALAGPVLDPSTAWLRSGYIFVVDARFTRDPAHPVAAGSSVLLVSSVAGG